MRLLYLDIDTLRPDHLGCYGYHRDTSPTIDALAAQGVRFDRCYASDTPCLPSRSALISGRFGIRNGAINHGGAAADIFAEGERRGFRTLLATTSWTQAMRDIGMYTATVSSFAERHSAYHFHAGFNEVINPGLRGMERADQITPLATEWLDRHGAEDDWFLHVHLWDPHTPYRSGAEVGEPFADAPIPRWLDEEVRRHHWGLPGPHSAQEATGFTSWNRLSSAFPRQPMVIESMADVRRMFDGYDTGIRDADGCLAALVEKLAELGVYDDTALIVSSDHGETLGELGIYCDHQTADEFTTRLPMVIRWPGTKTPGRVDDGLCYQIDVAATVLDLLGASVPAGWDGRSFASAFRDGASAGRDHLVLSQAAWCVQRAVRSADWLYIATYHDGFHGFPEAMLFDLADDPHEQRNLADDRPDLVHQAADLLADWREDALARSPVGADPMQTVLAGGGGYHVRGELPGYLTRLRETGRGEWADRLAARHETDPPFIRPSALQLL